MRGLLQGDVDSEHAGALFCNSLEGFPRRRDYGMTELRGAMRTMLAELRALSAEASLAACAGGGGAGANARAVESGKPWGPSSMNFAVSDGVGLIVTRYRYVFFCFFLIELSISFII